MYLLLVFLDIISKFVPVLYVPVHGGSEIVSEIRGEWFIWTHLCSMAGILNSDQLVINSNSIRECKSMHGRPRKVLIRIPGHVTVWGIGYRQNVSDHDPLLHKLITFQECSSAMPKNAVIFIEKDCPEGFRYNFLYPQCLKHGTCPVQHEQSSLQQTVVTD